MGEGGVTTPWRRVLVSSGDGAGGWGQNPTDNVVTHGKEPRFFSNPLSKPDKHWELREG